MDQLDILLLEYKSRIYPESRELFDPLALEYRKARSFRELAALAKRYGAASGAHEQANYYLRLACWGLGAYAEAVPAAEALANRSGAHATDAVWLVRLLTTLRRHADAAAAGLALEARFPRNPELARRTLIALEKLGDTTQAARLAALALKSPKLTEADRQHLAGYTQSPVK